MKFSPPDGTVHVRLRHVGKALLMSVRDEGPGIPPEELETVFDKFVQSSKTKSNQGGTGLGLAICREIVAGHQGRIWAENNATAGCIFYCELPLAYPELLASTSPQDVGCVERSEPINEFRLGLGPLVLGLGPWDRELLSPKP